MSSSLRFFPICTLLVSLFGGVKFFGGQDFSASDIGVILTLVLLEGLLSIDNALVLGLLAKRLPKEQQASALWYGLVGAFVFRFIAVLTASLLLQWTIVKLLGGGYLAWIALKHLLFGEHSEDDHAEAGTHESETSESTKENKPKAKKYPSFWGTVLVIEMTDIAFAVDSILAAIALVGSRQEKLWVIVAGGIMGMMLMRFAASLFMRLLERFPRFELSAYLLVLIIGLKLLGDWAFNSDWSFDKQKYAGAVVDSLGMRETFKGVEKSRLGAIASYENWLDKNWIFGLPSKHEEHADETHSKAEHAKEEHTAEDHAPATDDGTVKVDHVPHLLDFHDLRRPECMTFWLTMLGGFAIGFLPSKKKKDLSGAAIH